ncbi:MAG: hypothetical protein H0X37_22390 [Herpetosiphonaceae bacterium]|nr:hypothetical protein [Herpetosiphonaceae bacterium]
MGHFDDPEAARPLFERELAILDANLTTVLRDPELRQEWVLATINLAMTYDFLEKYDMARRLYREAEAKCERARLPHTHGLRAVIATGRARLPAIARRAAYERTWDRNHTGLKLPGRYGARRDETGDAMTNGPTDEQSPLISVSSYTRTLHVRSVTFTCQG